jgi:NAD(P)-dependent dehydrogenase (short-subunit alcohol dehydrogenase family)
MDGRCGAIRLTGRAAIVTGAGSQRGIGLATAVRLAQEGADVVVSDLDLSGAEKTAAEIRSLSRRSLAVQTDVTSEENIGDLARATLQEFGRIDILVNNAGITQPKRMPDIAALVCFLASAEAGYITGEDIDINGGPHMD